VVIEAEPSEAERRRAGGWADSEPEGWAGGCRWAAASAVAECQWEVGSVVAASAAAVAVSVVAVTEEAEEAEEVTGNQPDPHSRARSKRANGSAGLAVSVTANPVGGAVSGPGLVTELKPSTRRSSGR
jgi:hypothetical protein